ncbi:hypothetical protein IWZ00DRAFT_486996 [Phyllosticta capitalensis]
MDLVLSLEVSIQFDWVLSQKHPRQNTHDLFAAYPSPTTHHPPPIALDYYEVADSHNQLVQRCEAVLDIVQAAYEDCSIKCGTEGNVPGNFDDEEPMPEFGDFDDDDDSTRDSGRSSPELGSAKDDFVEDDDQTTFSEGAYEPENDEMEFDEEVPPNTLPVPTWPKFPKSNMRFIKNGAEIIDVCKAAYKLLAGSKRDQKEIEWVGKAIVFMCKVFATDGLKVLKKNVGTLRCGGLRKIDQLQIGDKDTDVGAKVGRFIQSVRFANRMGAVLDSKEYALARCMFDIASAWGDVKQSIQNQDELWTGLLEDDEDVDLLRQQSNKRNSLALGFGCLALRTYPELKQGASIDKDSFNKCRNRLPVVCFEDLAIFKGSVQMLVFWISMSSAAAHDDSLCSASRT